MSTSNQDQDAPGAASTPPAEEEQGHGPIWSASEAARRCGISRATMTRRLQADAIPGATRDESGAWLVPLSGLLAAGFHPDRPAPAEEEDPQDQDDTADALRDAHHARELAEVRAALELERARRQAAEELAAERAARVADLRQALLALAPPETPQDADTAPETPPPSPEPVPNTSTPQQATPGPSSTPPAQQDQTSQGPLRRFLHRLRGN